jgi:hypothetical protein
LTEEHWEPVGIEHQRYKASERGKIEMTELAAMDAKAPSVAYVPTNIAPLEDVTCAASPAKWQKTMMTVLARPVAPDPSGLPQSNARSKIRHHKDLPLFLQKVGTVAMGHFVWLCGRGFQISWAWSHNWQCGRNSLKALQLPVLADGGERKQVPLALGSLALV